MEEKACLSCGINVPQRVGKKPRLYCGSVCRQRDWYKKRKEALDRLQGKGGIPLPSDYMDIKAIGILKEDGTVEPLKFPKVTGQLRLAAEALQTLKNEINYVTPGAEAYDSPKLDKVTMDEAALYPVLKPIKPSNPKKQPDVPKIEEKPVEPPKIELEKHVVKKSFNQWLNLAREIELEDEKEEFKRELAADPSLTPRQKEMINSKLKK